MSFGWSAGDIVAALKLLYKIGSALKDSGGASSDFQDIHCFLQTLSQTLEHLNALQATPSDTDLSKNLREQCDQIRVPLVNFLSDVGRRFEPALGLNSRRNRILTAPRKIQWALSTSKKIKRLQDRITVPMTAVGLILSHHIIQTSMKMPNDIQDRISHILNTVVDTKITPTTTLINAKLDSLVAIQASAIDMIIHRSDDIERSTGELLHANGPELAPQEPSAEATTTLKTDLEDLSIPQSTFKDELLQCFRQSGHDVTKSIHMQSSDARARSSSLNRKLDQVDATLGAVRDSLRGLSDAKLNFDPEISKSEVKRAFRNILGSIWLLLSSVQFLIRELVMLLAPYIMVLYRNTMQRFIQFGDHFLFEDAIGRIKRLPCARFQHWDVFYDFLINSFQQEPGLSLVLAQRFMVLNKYNDYPISREAWRAVIQPESKIIMAMISNRKFVKGRCADPSCWGRVTFSETRTALICPICAKHLCIREAKTSNNDYKPSSPITVTEKVPARRQAMGEPKPATPSPTKIGPEKPKFRRTDPSNQKALDIHEKEFRSFKRIIYLTSMESSKPSRRTVSQRILDKIGISSNEQNEDSTDTMSVSSMGAIAELGMGHLYIKINGRRYCGEYYMPNDFEEQNRLQFLHCAYLEVLGGRLTTVALQNPTKILDVGTGCGEWALDMSDKYPEAAVIGTDIAPIQPSVMLQNTYFMIDDAEDGRGWVFDDDEFDLVHFRSMVGAFTDWDHIYRQTYKHLKAGGWVEVMEFDDYEGMLPFFPLGSQMESWLAAIAEGSRKSGQPRGTMHLEHSRLTDLGFVDVCTEEYSIPMEIWPENGVVKGDRNHFMISQLCGTEALGLRLLTEQMGWDPDEVRVISDIISNEIRELLENSKKAEGLVSKVRVMKGRKPIFPKEYNLGGSISMMRKRTSAYVQDEGVHGL